MFDSLSEHREPITFKHVDIWNPSTYGYLHLTESDCSSSSCVGHFVPAIVVAKNTELSSFPHVQGELFDELFLTETNMVTQCVNVFEAQRDYAMPPPCTSGAILGSGIHNLSHIIQGTPSNLFTAGQGAQAPPLLPVNQGDGVGVDISGLIHRACTSNLQGAVSGSRDFELLPGDNVDFETLDPQLYADFVGICLFSLIR
jgi:hypothetical protein